MLVSTPPTYSTDGQGQAGDRETSTGGVAVVERHDVGDHNLGTSIAEAAGACA